VYVHIAGKGLCLREVRQCLLRHILQEIQRCHILQCGVYPGRGSLRPCAVQCLPEVSLAFIPFFPLAVESAFYGQQGPQCPGILRLPGDALRPGHIIERLRGGAHVYQQEGDVQICRRERSGRGVEVAGYQCLLVIVQRLLIPAGHPVDAEDRIVDDKGRYHRPAAAAAVICQRLPEKMKGMVAPAVMGIYRADVHQRGDDPVGIADPQTLAEACREQADRAVGMPCDQRPGLLRRPQLRQRIGQDDQRAPRLRAHHLAGHALPR